MRESRIWLLLPREDISCVYFGCLINKLFLTFAEFIFHFIVLPK